MATDNVWDAVTRAADNLRAQNLARVIPSPGAISPIAAFATGGYVSGPGSSTSDSISARLSNGEFVMRAAAVDRFGVGLLDQMNDNFRMPAVAMPVGGGDGVNRELLAEIKRLNQKVERLEAAIHRGTAATAAGAQHVREGVDTVANNTANVGRAERRKAAA